MAPRESLNRIVYVFLFILLLVFFVIIWQVGNWSGLPNSSTTAKDWKDVQPIISTVAYKVDGADYGSFEAVFQNTMNASIWITGISITDNLTAAEPTCFIVTVGGVDEPGNWIEVIVKQKEQFELSAICPIKKAGDTYDLQINMTYIPLQSELNIEQTETGTIRGYAE